MRRNWIMNSKRQAKGKRGHVVQIRVCRLTETWCLSSLLWLGGRYCYSSLHILHITKRFLKIPQTEIQSQLGNWMKLYDYTARIFLKYTVSFSHSQTKANMVLLQYNDFRMTLKWKRANKTETTNEWKYSDLIGLSNGYKRPCILVG